MSTWVLDPDHTVAEFAVRHMMVTWVRGRFSRVSGKLNFDPQDVAAAAVQVTIEAASLSTGVEKRDNHLKSEDFLDAERFPAIVFASTRVELAGLDHAWVYGDLTLRGITRPVMLDVRWAGPSHFDDEGTIYTTFGFQAQARLNREDFGMTWNTELEHGGVMVGRHVYITLDAEADLEAD